MFFKCGDWVLFLQVGIVEMSKQAKRGERKAMFNKCGKVGCEGEERKREREREERAKSGEWRGEDPFVSSRFCSERFNLQSVEFKFDCALPVL